MHHFHQRNIANLDRYSNAPLATGYLAAYALSMRGAKDAHTILASDPLAGLSPVEVTSSILATDPQLVALSVYNWNRDFVMEVTRSLGDIDPKLPNRPGWTGGGV